MHIVPMIEQLAEQAAENVIPSVPGDYVGKDGLLYCGKCHTKKQHRLYAEFLHKEMTVCVPCKCEQERRDKEEAERALREKQDEIRRMKGTCIHDRALLECTFENDDGSLPILFSAKNYVDTWPEQKEKNNGLLLWGGVGTGKTYYAACIANALIEAGTSVLMTNFSKILNQLSGLYSDEKNQFIDSLMKYSLLIIDDFGIERSTEYALEQVFNIIDERYKTNLPLIVTTNLSIDTLQNPADIAHQRIYDRVLSMCIPISFQGENHRKSDREKKFKDGSSLFENGGYTNDGNETE